MKRRLVVATLLAGMALSLVVPHAGTMSYAAELQGTVSGDLEDSSPESNTEMLENITISDSIADLDNDTLFGEYVDQLFDVNESDNTSEHGIARRESLTIYQQRMYDEIKSMVKAVAAGTQSGAQVTISIDTLEGRELFQMYKDNRLGDYIEEIWHALYRDMPYEFYWFGNSASATNIRVASGAIYTMTFQFAVAKDYNTTGEAYTTDSDGKREYCYEADVERTGAASKAVQNADAIVQSAEGKSLYDALSYFKDEICRLTDYNYDAADAGLAQTGSNPWQIIYVFDGNPDTKVVCEGYAKAFKYLCDQWGIRSHNADCYLVTGMSYSTVASSYGGHMWNVIQTSKGNYLVDVTNCDSGSDGYPDKLFLQAPSLVETDDYDGVTRTIGYTFNDGHVRYSYYIEYTNGTRDSDTLAEYTENEVGLSSNDYLTDWGDHDSADSNDKGDSGADTGASGTGTTEDSYTGWKIADGKSYWYENGVKQGTTGRGKEIYDPDSGAWYWLDAVQGGAKAVSKDVYQPYTIQGKDTVGKWVRYDANGYMVKGWQTTSAGTYYFDQTTGAMAKGKVTIDGLPCWFDDNTGIGKNLVWEQVSGQDYYWYENGQRQGYDPKDESYRGKEIFDPNQNAWFWLDNNAQGKKAVGKDVYQPYTIQGKDTIGKWVHYDAAGRMIKGWYTDIRGTYYFDPTTGAMAKDSRTIDGRTYQFDSETGILK